MATTARSTLATTRAGAATTLPSIPEKTKAGAATMALSTSETKKAAAATIRRRTSRTTRVVVVTTEIHPIDDDRFLVSISYHDLAMLSTRAGLECSYSTVSIVQRSALQEQWFMFHGSWLMDL